MSVKRLDQITEILRVIAHPCRIRVIIHIHQQGSMTLPMLLSHIDIEQSALSIHLFRMKKKGILIAKRQQNVFYYSLAEPVIADIVGIIVRP